MFQSKTDQSESSQKIYEKKKKMIISFRESKSICLSIKELEGIWKRILKFCLSNVLCNSKVLQKTGFHMAVTAGVLQNPTVLGRPGQQHIKARSSRRKGSPISIFVEEAQGSLAASSAVK